MRVVIDCNIVVSAARTDGVCRKVIVEAVRHHLIILSSPIVAEYEAVAERPKLTPFRHVLRANIDELQRVALTVEPADVRFGLRDPDDEVYLATAVAGEAALITGNKRDFTKPRYGTVAILSPNAFLERTS